MDTQTMVSKYEQQALDFLKATNTTLDIDYIGHGYHFDEDKQTRDIYRFTLTRAGRKYTAKFGQSIAHSGTATASVVWKDGGFDGDFSKRNIERKRQAPTVYDILACLTKYDVGTLDDFCSEFGYDTDSKTAERVYVAVQREYKGVCLIWNAREREQLAEIN